MSGESAGEPRAFLTGANCSLRCTSSSATLVASLKASKMKSSSLMPAVVPGCVVARERASKVVDHPTTQSGKPVGPYACFGLLEHMGHVQLLPATGTSQWPARPPKPERVLGFVLGLSER